MSNELLIILSALVDVGLVFLAARLGSRWLFGTIGVNLILVSVFGLKLISVFGLVTNVGNVFYGSVFLATHFIIEQKEINARQTIWTGSFFVIFFLLMSQFALHYAALNPGDAVSTAMQTLFSLSFRISCASILAYIFAQHINIFLYHWFKDRLKGNMLWLQSLGANAIAQLADSSLFFTIAFLDLSGTLLVQAIFAGWIIKVCVVILGTPFLYLDRYIRSNT